MVRRLPVAGTRDPAGGQCVCFLSRLSLFLHLFYGGGRPFAGFWRSRAPQMGGMVILVRPIFSPYFQVQVSVAINAWYGPFYDMIQAALAKPGQVTLPQFYAQLATFAGIAMVAVVVGVMTRFFVSHYIFRWRTAMNDYYMENWSRLRFVEGASQRVQDDTMRFSSTMEGLGVNLIDSVMTS